MATMKRLIGRWEIVNDVNCDALQVRFSDEYDMDKHSQHSAVPDARFRVVDQ